MSVVKYMGLLFIWQHFLRRGRNSAIFGNTNLSVLDKFLIKK